MKREFILVKFENPDILDHMEKITKELLFAYNEIAINNDNCKKRIDSYKKTIYNSKHNLERYLLTFRTQ